MTCVLAFAEQRDGQFKKAAIETISQGRRIAAALGGECVGLVVGSGVADLASGLGAYGADRVLVVDHADLKNYANAAYAKAIAVAARTLSPSAILLGATAMGDIGQMFPDTDERYRGISSLVLLEHVAKEIASKGYRVSNIDSTIAAQAPRLAPHVELMRENIAKALGVETGQVSVKATTTEKMGFAGRGEGIAVWAVALVEK